MGLHVGVTFNLKTDYPGGNHPEDWAAECEDWSTVERIAASLCHLGHRVTLLPFQRNLCESLVTNRPDLVLNIAEGWNGRNRESLVPALLEFLEIPYTGSDPLTLGLALDKCLCKRVLAGAGVPVTTSRLISSAAEAWGCDLVLPAFVKPNTEGSSKGVRLHSRVSTRAELAAQVEWVTREYQQPALVEPFLSGREFTIGVLGNTPPTTLPVMEVYSGERAAHSPDFVYSFETKSGNLETLSCPAELAPDAHDHLCQIALAAHTALGCRDISRVDIRMDAAGNPFFLEINPLPGLSSCSLLPLQAAAAGMSFDQLVAAIVQAACDRYQMGHLLLPQIA